MIEIDEHSKHKSYASPGREVRCSKWQHIKQIPHADDLVRHTLNHVVISASGLLVMEPVTQVCSHFNSKFIQFCAIYFHDLNSFSI